MNTTEIEAPPLQTGEDTESRKQSLYATGGAIGAILASTCCIVPLLFVTLGVSGAWIGNLTALETYKPFVAVVTFAFIGMGFRQVYFKARPACADESYCAKPQSALITKTALWLSTAIVLLALTINWWAPFLY